jgi:hypothetical protein
MEKTEKMLDGSGRSVDREITGEALANFVLDGMIRGGEIIGMEFVLPCGKDFKFSKTLNEKTGEYEVDRSVLTKVRVISHDTDREIFGLEVLG